MTTTSEANDIPETIVLERTATRRLRHDVGFVQLYTKAGASAEAKVAAENFGTISVWSARDIGLTNGEVVYVGWDGNTATAVVRHIQPHKNGKILFGLEWTTDEPS